MEENKKNYKLYKVIMLVIITAFITFIITSIGMYQYLGNSDYNKLEMKLSELKKLIDENYLGEVDESELEEGAISGYIEAIGDTYSEYITAEDMEDYTTSLLGNFVGIGIYMVQDTESNRIKVLAPIKESPAEKAGILSGDLIIKVDDVEYTADDMTLVSTIIKGEEGSTVKLEILRGEETLTFEITREKINTNPISTEILEDNIGYMEISSFDENTAQEFKEKYEALQEQNIDSLIIDLRNNGGGIVSEALQIANYIADKGSTLLITVDKNENEEITVATEDPIVDVPVIILVNENTASASEILAGALQDLNKATLVGTQTYGKGVIQSVYTFFDGSGLKLTTEEYYTPNRNQINNIGIEPDEIVELPEEVENPLLVEREQDTQLQKAIELLK